MEINRISDISAFVAAVNAGSYTQAARTLGITRSAVGKSVVRLEERLSVRLLHRTTRTLRLTEEGKILFDYCRQILDDLDEIDQVMAIRRRCPTGVLKLTAPHSLGHQYILPVLNSFLGKWPALKAQVAFTDRFVDLIEEGFDLAIRVGHPAEDSQLLTRTIATQTMQTCAAPAYLARRGTPDTPDGLAGHDTIFFRNSLASAQKDWHFAHAGQTFTYSGTGRITLDSSDAILASALAGSGIIQLPTYLTHRAVASGALTPILTGYTAPPDPIRILYPSKKHLAPRIRLFIDTLTAQWQDALPWERP